jgi:hypothetical protein
MDSLSVVGTDNPVFEARETLAKLRREKADAVEVVVLFDLILFI